jgi:phage gp36-like protein
MDKFLVKYDFETLIQEVNLDEITNSTDRIINDSIDEAVSEAAGYIRNRYDESVTFKVVQTYSKTATYLIDDRVFWSPTAYDALATYITGDQISFDIGTSPEVDEKIYIANQSVAAGETPLTHPAKWDLKADNNTFYTCIADTTAGDLPTDVTKFTAGDNREPKLKTVVVDIALYNIHSRITPRDIPEIRQIRYDGAGNKDKSEHAIGWLEKVQKGTITPDLTVRTDDDGVTEQNTERFSYGTSTTTSYKYQ